MANATRDENSVPSLLGVLNSNGSTTIPIKSGPNDHALFVSDGTDGLSLGNPNAKRDQNNVPSLMGVSSADGRTPIVVYATSDGYLLVKST